MLNEFFVQLSQECLDYRQLSLCRPMPIYNLFRKQGQSRKFPLNIGVMRSDNVCAQAL